MNDYKTMKLAEFAMIVTGIPKEKCTVCGNMKICQNGYCVECYCRKVGRKIE